MEYGILYLSKDFEDRKDLPNMEALPKKCCANCNHWIECTRDTPTGEESKGYGGCVEHSDYEWDAFTWADDVCERYVPLEED